MSNRADDPRLGYRRQGAHADARNHFDHSASNFQRPFGQEESSRNVPHRNAKYYNMESDSRNRLTKDRHSSKDQDFDLAAGSNHGGTRFPSSSSQSEMRKQSGELNAAKHMSADDEDMFLYGSETGSSVYLKDYMHGQTEPQKTSADVENLSISEAAAEKQDYDPTIENILKSIGFNIDLSQVVTEPTSKIEATVEKKRTTAIQASDPSIMVSEAFGASTIRGGFSKKIDSILPAQETYEARAKRYREEQTRLYAEANASSDLMKVVPKLSPVVPSGRSSLELLQSSYDYDAVIKGFAKEIESKEVQRDDWAGGNESETESNVDPAATNRTKRTLYEDFSDSDDNLSDSEKQMHSKMKKAVDHFEAENQRPTASTPRFQDDAAEKRRIVSGIDARMKTIEPSYRNSNAERILSAEKASKSVQESETTEKPSRQVKIIPNTTASETNSGRNSSGSVRYAVGSKWDSPKRDEPQGVETGVRNVVDPNITEKRQSKLESLNKELDRLKQGQKEIMRRKQRGRHGHKDPELLENSRYQANVSSEIDRLMKCTDEEFSELEARKAKTPQSTERKVIATSRQKVESSSALTPEVSSTRSEKKSDSSHKERPKLQKMIVRYDYFDDGDHWCSSCNSVFATIDELCQHLHSSKHHEKMDLNHRPWAPKDTVVKKGCKGVPVPIKGVEFLMPSQAFYCSLCSVFTGDARCADDHLKSNEHNECYQRLLESDTTYEHRYNLDKEAAMSLIVKLQLKNKNDNGMHRFGSSTKRPSFLKPSNQNDTKRSRFASELSEKALNDDSSDMQDAKSDTDDKVSNALSDGSHADKHRVKTTHSASKAPSTPPTKTALPQKKPAFIGKLPCLTGAKNRSSVSRVTKTNGVDVKESNESSDSKQASLHIVETSQTQGVGAGESQTVVYSSTLCPPEDDLTAIKKSRPVPVDDIRERDDEISSAVGQRLAAIKSSQPSLPCSQEGVSGNQDETHKTEPEEEKSVGQSCVTEVMSMGDFEIFDECDAE